MTRSTVDTYDYTPNGTVKSKARNGETILNYLTDKNGNITRVTDANGDYTGYTYDEEGRLKTVTDGATVAATYTYNADSTIAGVKYSTGISTIYGYDSDKNTRLVSKKADGKTLDSYSYTYDNNGNQLTKKENGKTTTYAYDKLNHLAGENKTTYTYDNAGNRLSKSDGTDNVTYSYDQRNMLTQESKNGIITTYNYDKNGNLTAESDGTQYTYDAFNQLVETDKQDGTWQQNVYDATGLRMATVENGTYTGYTFDRDNIIAEYNKDDSMTTRYIRGYDLISQKKDTGETYNYLHNAHGDITKLVDTAGKVQDSYCYDAFGNTTTYAEKVGNQFRYVGEQYDSITGEYYLRARYYEPAMGRFMNEDTYKGQIENPQSMNLYAYCVNNPIIYTDPSGHNATKCSSGQGTGNRDYIGKYPKAYINGIIKSYETHKKVKGRFVLDNGGQTIGYGHDLLPGENFSAGLSKQEALDLLIKDLDKKYATIEGYIKSLNSGYGYNIDINKFSENEVLFLVDFVFNRGAGLVQRSKLKKAKKPYSSLAILIIAVSKKNDKKIKKILMEETKNTKGVYYEGLKLRRMDEYEICKFGDFVRDYDVKRDYTKQKN